MLLRAYGNDCRMTAGSWWRPSAPRDRSPVNQIRPCDPPRPPDVSINPQLNLSKILIPIASGVVRQQLQLPLNMSPSGNLDHRLSVSNLLARRVSRGYHPSQILIWKLSRGYRENGRALSLSFITTTAATAAFIRRRWKLRQSIISVTTS